MLQLAISTGPCYLRSYIFSLYYCYSLLQETKMVDTRGVVRLGMPGKFNLAVSLKY